MLPISNVLEKIIPGSKDESFEKEYLLSLVVHERSVQAGIWNFFGQEGQCLSTGSWESWGGENTEELIVAADTSVATAISGLTEISGEQPKKVVLGIPDSWAEGPNIKETKKEILQAVCKKLTLKPLGFVVIPEAIAQILKKEEGELASLILVNIEEGEIVVSLIVQGKFIGSQVVGRSNSLALDVEEGLLRFNFKESFPSRILLLGQGSLEEERQSLIAYPWVTPEGSEKPLFLQIPKVEIAQEDFETRAVILASSRELKKEEKKEEKKSFLTPSLPEVEITEKQITTKEEKSSLIDLPEESFGFVKGMDLEEEAAETKIQKESLPSEKLEEEAEQEAVLMTQISPVESQEVKEISKRPRKNYVKKLLLLFSSFLVAIKNLFSLVLKGFKNKGFLLAGVGVGGVLGIVILILTFAAKAEVKLLGKPWKIDQEFQFTVSARENQINSEKMILPGRELVVKIPVKKTNEVKGKKIVGDKAKGEIVIYNGSEKNKTFSKGTSLKTPEGLKFVLLEEITVPAKTTDFNSTPPIDKWGEAKVEAEAAQIGAEYNIPVNITLNLESLATTQSGFLAKTASDFSGGSSREIQAVAKEDKENLLKESFQEAENQAKEQLKNQISPNDFLLEDSMRLKEKSERFDKEVGDEASQITLEGEYTFLAYYFTESDWKNLAEQVILKQKPVEYQKIPQEEIKNFSLVKKDEKKGEYLYLAKIQATFLPEIDSLAIAKNLKLKSFAAGKKYLNSLNNVVGFDVNFRPNFLSFLNFFPFQEKNIKVEIKGI